MSTISFDTQELPYLNPEFIGIGKVLENKRRQRRNLMQKEKLLESKVTFFQKEDKRTAKSIQNHRKQLQRIMLIRQRRQDQRQQKRLQQYLNNQELNRLRQQSQIERKTHQMNKQEAMDRLNRRNRNAFLTVKGKLDKDFSEKRQIIKEEKQLRHENFSLIQNLKKNGKDKVISHWRAKNSQAVYNYRNMIKRQQALKAQLEDKMTYLQQREDQLANKLKANYTYKQKLQNAIEKSSEIDLDQFEALLSDRPRSFGKQSRSTSIGFRTTRNTHLANMSRRLEYSASPQKKPLSITFNNFKERLLEKNLESFCNKKSKNKRKQVVQNCEDQN